MSNVHGLPLRPLPDGYVVIEAMVLLKVLNDAGEPRWIEQWTPGLNDMERLGMLSSAVRTCERALTNSAGPLGS